MTALIRAHADSGPAAATDKTAVATLPATTGAALHVIHAKAPLRDSPDASVAPHVHLVQGDEVTLPDRSKAGDGWLKVRYAAKSGTAIERWIRADDMETDAH